MRIAITGCPRAGKTTYADTLDAEVKHTDDLIERGWAEARDGVAEWFDDSDVEVIEGVTVVRALRKWLDQNIGSDNKPVDKIIYLRAPFEKLSMEQERMRKGLDTMWFKIKPILLDRGVLIEEPLTL